ncbi:MAG: hypothetical protein U0R68_09925 [Candidatus Nanopelagicales bacterium]
MATTVRVMVEQGAKKRVVACAFDWPGWDRSVRHGGDVLAMLESYRPRYAVVAESAGYGEEFAALGRLRVVEELEGTGMTDYYGVSGRTATGEVGPMSDAELERKVALLEAAWRTFDETAARVSPELRLGPRGGGRSRDEIVGHVNRAEIGEFSPKVGVKAPIETWEDRDALLAYRRDVVDGIRAVNARGEKARTWELQTLVRRLAWHMLDHAWELEDRDLTGADDA